MYWQAELDPSAVINRIRTNLDEDRIGYAFFGWPSADRREGYLAGAAIYGSEAGTWIDFLTLIINQKIKAEDLQRMIFAFPTQTYMLVSTLIPLLR